MRQSRHFLMGLALGTMGLALVLTVSVQGEGPLPAGDLARLIGLEAKHIEAEVSKGKLLKKGQKKVRMAAFMIAVYAENAKQKPDAMATLRDQALKVMKAAEAGNVDEAKKLAATLSPNIKPEAGARPAPIPLEKQLDLETVMRMFSGEKVGGFGMEKALEDLVEAKKLDAGKLGQTALLAQKVSFIAKVTRAYVPAEQGKKTKKGWDELCTQMDKEASALAAAARDSKEAEVSKVAGQLTATCTKCHDIFR